MRAAPTTRGLSVLRGEIGCDGPCRVAVRRPL